MKLFVLASLTLVVSFANGDVSHLANNRYLPPAQPQHQRLADNKYLPPEPAAVSNYARSQATSYAQEGINIAHDQPKLQIQQQSYSSHALGSGGSVESIRPSIPLATFSIKSRVPETNVEQNEMHNIISYAFSAQAPSNTVASSLVDGHSAGAYAGGFNGASSGGFGGGSSVAGLSGVSGSSLGGASTGGFNGVPSGGFSGASVGSFSGTSGSSLGGDSTGGFNGAPGGGFSGGSIGGFSGVSGSSLGGASTEGFNGAPAGGYSGLSDASVGSFSGVSGSSLGGDSTGGFNGSPAVGLSGNLGIGIAAGFSGNSVGSFNGASSSGLGDTSAGYSNSGRYSSQTQQSYSPSYSSAGETAAHAVQQSFSAPAAYQGNSAEFSSNSIAQSFTNSVSGYAAGGQQSYTTQAPILQSYSAPASVPVQPSFAAPAPIQQEHSAPASAQLTHSAPDPVQQGYTAHASGAVRQGNSASAPIEQQYSVPVESQLETAYSAAGVVQQGLSALEAPAVSQKSFSAPIAIQQSSSTLETVPAPTFPVTTPIRQENSASVPAESTQFGPGPVQQGCGTPETALIQSTFSASGGHTQQEYSAQGPVQQTYSAPSVIQQGFSAPAPVRQGYSTHSAVQQGFSVQAPNQQVHSATASIQQGFSAPGIAAVQQGFSSPIQGLSDNTGTLAHVQPEYQTNSAPTSSQKLISHPQRKFPYPPATSQSIKLNSAAELQAPLQHTVPYQVPFQQALSAPAPEPRQALSVPQLATVNKQSTLALPVPTLSGVIAKTSAHASFASSSKGHAVVRERVEFNPPAPHKIAVPAAILAQEAKAAAVSSHSASASSFRAESGAEAAFGSGSSALSNANEVGTVYGSNGGYVYRRN